MMVFPVRVEHALGVRVQRPHDADPRMHQRPAQASEAFEKVLKDSGVDFTKK
jgi:hypothetical protein